MKWLMIEVITFVLLVEFTCEGIQVHILLSFQIIGMIVIVHLVFSLKKNPSQGEARIGKLLIHRKQRS